MSTSILLKPLRSFLFLTGLVLALFVWVIGPVINVVLLQEGSFYQQFTQPSAHEMYMRSIISALFIIFGYLGGLLLNRCQRTDDALQDIERRYRSLVENSVTGIRWNTFGSGIPVDLPVEEQIRLIIQNTTIVECNEQFARMYGYTRTADVIGNSLTALLKMTPELVETLESYVRNGYTSRDVEVRETLPDGTVKYFLNNAQGTVENGKLIQSLSVVIDITDRKQVEIRERALGRIIDESLNEIYIFAADSLKFLEVNKGARNNLGYSMEELREMTPLDIKPTLTEEVFREKIEPLLTDRQEKVNFEAIHERKDGSCYSVEIYLQLLSYQSQSSCVAIILDITERKQVEMALRQSEERYRSLVEGSLAGIRLTRYRQGIPTDLPVKEQVELMIQHASIIECNEQYAKMYGYENVSEIVNIPYTDLATVTPELLDMLESFVKGGYMLEDTESREVLSDGSVKYFLNTARGTVENGKLIQTWGVVNDTTERKRAEQALGESEEKYRVLFEKSADAILIIDDGKFVDCNQAAVEMLCYASKNEFLNCQPYQLSPPKQVDGRSSLEKADEMMSIALEQGSHRFEWMHLRKNGEIFPAEVLLTAVPVRGKKILHCVWRDITERKWAEKELRESEEKLSKIFDATLQGVGISRLRDGQLVYVNPGLAKLVNLPMKDVSSMTTMDFWVNLKDRMTLIKKLRENGQVANFETRLRSMDGKIFPVFISASLVEVDGEECMVALINDITERKQMEDALRESENLYRSLVENSFQGIRWYKIEPGVPIDLPVDEQVELLTKRATVGECNDQYARMYGYRQAEDVIGTHSVALKKKTPALLEMIEAYVANNYVLKATESCEILSDGTEKYFLNTEIGTVENGKLTRSWGVVNDITERKQAEKTVAKRESQLIESQKIARLGSWEMSLISQKLEWSEEAYRLFDKDPYSFSPGFDAFIRMVHPDDVERWQNAFNEAMENGDKPYSVVVRIINDSGREWVMKSIGQVYRDEKNNVVRFGGTLQDITEHKRLEKLMRYVAEGVMGETGEEFLQSLVRHVAIGFDVEYAFIGLLAGEDKSRIQTIAVSARGENVDNFSYDLEGTPCKNIISGGPCIHPRDVQAKFPDDLLLVKMGVDSYAASPLRNPDGESIGLLVVLDSGEIEQTEAMMAILQLFAIRTAAELQRFEAERQVNIAHQQLVEQKRGETEQVQKELDRLKEKLVTQTRLAAVGQVAASIAHELRNPLGAVRNAAYYMNRRLIGDNPKIAKYLDIIDQEIDVSDRIISNLLEMTRAKEPVKQKVNLGSVVAEGIERVKPADTIRCHLQFEEEPFVVNVDPAQLRQVLDNLLVNALQSIEAEGDIFIRGQRADGMDIITVQDTGAGIDAEQQTRLFEPLFTTKAKGTGLGLTISRQIIEKNGGTLEYVEQDGRGAMFRIKLPQRTNSSST